MTAGVSGLIEAIKDRVFHIPIRLHPVVCRMVEGKSGLELGGPSEFFGPKGLLPLYPIVGTLDNCNFSHQTIWEGNIREGATFLYDENRPPGRQYVLEMTDLRTISAGTYDFVLSCATLEHTANPLKALGEMHRVLRVGGVFVLVLPHRKGTFDHRRPTTSMAHLIGDLNNDTPEEDTTHVPEILSLHDLTRDPEACNRDTFETRIRKNLEYRCIHHHVFDTDLAVQCVTWAGFRVVDVETVRQLYICVLATKLDTK